MHSDVRGETVSVDTNMKCYFNCMSEQVGILDENFKVDVSKVEALAKYEEKPDLNIILECKEQHDATTDNCEYSYNLIVCIMEKELNKSK